MPVMMEVGECFDSESFTSIIHGDEEDKRVEQV